MIYRFSARQVGLEKAIEVQLQAPSGEPIEKLIQALRTSFSKEGVELDSLQFIGSIDTDFQGIVVPKCRTQGCENTVDNLGDYCQECRTATIHGWHNPIANTQAHSNKCVVRGCDRESIFHLCDAHALPGSVVEVRGRKFVIGTWLVEREGRMRLITMNDYTLGNLFGGREAFEKRLQAQGYKIHYLISRPEQLETAKRRNPGLRITLWSPDLPRAENDAHDGTPA
jgi:hypothetical protein